MRPKYTSKHIPRPLMSTTKVKKTIPSAKTIKKKVTGFSHEIECPTCTGIFTKPADFHKHACDQSMRTRCSCGKESKTRLEFLEHFKERHVLDEGVKGSACKICCVRFKAADAQITHWQGHGQQVLDVPGKDQRSKIKDRKSNPSMVDGPRLRRLKVAAVEDEEELNEEKDFWSGKSESNDCPLCDEEVGKTMRKAHFKKFHYDEFFRLASNMSDVEQWISCRIGASGEDVRCCLDCKWRPAYKGRIGLLKHIKEAHHDKFLRMKNSYRLYSRTRKPEDVHVHRMLD